MLWPCEASVWQWRGNGVAKGCQWRGNGVAMARQWRGNGKMWHGNGVAIAWQWRGHGVAMGLPWCGNGVAMARQWRGNVVEERKIREIAILVLQCFSKKQEAKFFNLLQQAQVK